MIKRSLLICCLMIIAGASSMSHSFQAEQTHGQWLKERYEEATSIKVGMTRADLKKLYYEDGGFQSATKYRYVLKSSGLIKVDVEFDSPGDMNNRTATDQLIRIKSISKPYLEEMFLD